MNEHAHRKAQRRAQLFFPALEDLWPTKLIDRVRDALPDHSQLTSNAPSHTATAGLEDGTLHTASAFSGAALSLLSMMRRSIPAAGAADLHAKKFRSRSLRRFSAQGLALLWSYTLSTSPSNC